MSLILSWENPPELYVPQVLSAELYRARELADKTASVLVAKDITWGVWEDVENSDPELFYEVRYVSSNQARPLWVAGDDVTRYRRPAHSCKIEFCLSQPDGAPAAGFSIAVSGNSEAYQKRLLTNNLGEAMLFLTPGQRVRFLIDGEPYAYEVAVPKAKTISWPDLRRYFGSPRPRDARGML